MNRTTTTDGSYIFQVEIKVTASSKGAALEQLLQVFNSADFADFRIGSGIKAPQPNPLELRIRQYIDTNKLIRLNINKGRGVKMDMPCRILNFDMNNQLITVYHVDEKQVYNFGLNEIDDFLE